MANANPYSASPAARRVGSLRSVRTDKKDRHSQGVPIFFGDPYGNRTHVTAVKGPCLNRLTNGPCAFSVRNKSGSGSRI